MFGPAYFGASYFGPVYFPPSGGEIIRAIEEIRSGGYRFWIAFEQAQLRNEEQRRIRARKKRKALKIKDKLERAIALEQRRIEERIARDAELERVSQLVSENQAYILSLENAKIERSLTEALERQTFSTLERLERELKQLREEEDFLLMAAHIILEL